MKALRKLEVADYIGRLEENYYLELRRIFLNGL